MSQKINIKMEPVNALNICALYEQLLNDKVVILPAAFRRALDELKDEVCKNITEEQIEDAHAVAAVDNLINGIDE